MAKNNNLGDFLTSLANKFRAKLGTTNTINPQDFENKVDEVYQVGYDNGQVSVEREINPKWSDWQYFSYGNNRNTMVAKLKFSDTSNGNNFFNMFYKCTALTSIPQIDTSNGTDFSGMFSTCTSLTSIPQIDTSKGTKFSGMFYNCTSLTDITFTGTFLVQSNISVFANSQKLTVKSLMSFINSLKNDSTTVYKVTIGSTNLAKLTEAQIAMATAKNITLA